MSHGFLFRTIRLLSVIALPIGMALTATCTKDNPAGSEATTWNVTFNVVDGYSGNKISGARVAYKQNADKDTFCTTNSQGQASVEHLAGGTCNFTLSYTDPASTKYTEVFLTLTSIEDSTGLKKLADRVATIKLFPLSGSISGKVIAQLHEMAPKVPASGITISMVYSNPELVSTTTFETKTDSAGAFQLNNLPVTTGFKITVPNTRIGSIDFTADSFALPTLQSKNTIPFGTIFLRPIDAKNFSLTNTVPGSISPNQAVALTYSDSLDTVSYAIFEGIGTAQTVKTNKTFKGKELTFVPAISLIDGNMYLLVVNAFGKTGGSAITKDTVKVAGGGMVDVVSSNILDANHQAINGMGLTDSMAFTFRSSVASGSATITKGTTVVLTDVIVKDKSIVVKPKGTWEPGTYSVIISAKLADSTITTFKFEITTVGGLDVVSSNIYNPQTKTATNGLKTQDTIIFVANKTLSSASAIVSLVTPPSPVPVTVSVSGSTVRIVPNDQLNPSTAYSLTLTMSTAQGESKSVTIPSTAPFTTASSTFFPLADNIRTNGDPSKPTLTFAPNGIIIVKMSTAVKTAAAQITSGGSVVTVSVKTSADSIFITPAANLKEGVGHTMQLSATSASGVAYSEKSFVIDFFVKNTFVPKTSNVRINDDPKQPVLDFPPSGIIVIIMSEPVQSATAALLNGTAVVATEVKTSKDTIKIIPHDLLSPAISYDLSLAAKGTSGLTYQAEADPFFVKGLRVQVNQVRVVASNVLSGDGIGLTNVPVGIAPYYVLSSTPEPTSLSVTMYSGTDTVKATVTVVGDTVKVKPTINLAAGKQFMVTIKGKTSKSDPIDIDLTGTNKIFTTRIAVIISASNMLDANGKPAINLPRTTELWVKFSRPLASDITKQQLGGGTGVSATYRSGASNNNVTIRVSVDTLFAKFNQNALPDDGDSVTLRGVSILFDDGTTLGADVVNLKSYILRRPTPHVIATNGVVNNTVVDNFDVLGEAWIVSSMSIRSIDGVKNGPDNLANVGNQNLLLSNTRLRGDTIFFKPAVRLNYATEYQVAFNVTLADSSKYTGTDLKLRWKTVRGAYLVAANDMVTGFASYRPFQVTGDSLVITFSKAIDLTKTFAIAGYAGRLTYSWSTGNTVVTVKSSDTLPAKPYSATPGYALTDTAQYDSIRITMTTTEGEAWTAKPTNVASIFNNTRPALAVHTIPGIEVLNTNLKVSSANRSVMYSNTDNRKMSALVTANLVVNNDSVGIGDTLKIYFSSAIDSGAVARSPTMVRLLAGTTVQNITISYAASRKTMLIKPTVLLTVATNYTLSLTDVQGAGMAASDGNGDISYSFAFKTRPAARKQLTTTQVVPFADTATTPGVLNKRLAYSGSFGNAYGTAGGLNIADVPDENTVKLMYYELAFRSANSADTVSHYQVSVKGGDGNWYELRNLITAQHFNQTSMRDSLRRFSLDLSATAVGDTDIYAVKVGPLMRIAALTDHRNAANIFNYGKNLQIRMRPVLSADNRWDATDQSGTWTTTPLTFQDNVAPCDTDFVAKDGAVARLQTVANGGVSITVSPCTMNRTGQGDGQYVFTLTFPEDMDITSDPTITTWYGATTTPPSTGITVDAANSFFSGNVYTYILTVKVPGGVDWSALDPYYAISIAGMKDASGQVIQTWGRMGATTMPANGTPRASVIGALQGTTNMRGLLDY